MSLNVEIEGKVIFVGDTNQVTDNFKKRELVVYVVNERNEDYSDSIKIEFKQDNVDKLDNVSFGDIVKVQCNLTGRPWEKDGKTNYFNGIDGWRIEKMQSDSDPVPEFKAQDTPLVPEEDNLPF